MVAWCGSCLSEAAALDQLRDRFGDGVSVLAVSSDPTDSEAAPRKFRVAAGDAGYPFAWDREGALARRLAVTALDTTLVHDADGKVVFRDAGPTDAATLQSALSKAGLA
jgi:thiol-disulfide isomerase/thioredoxin